MNKKTLALELMQQIVQPAMNNFAENGIVETLMPSFETKKSEFECLLLNCTIVMSATERQYPSQFKNAGVFNEFTFACLAYYEVEKLFMPQKNYFDEEEVTKELFEKWENYEVGLGKLAETKDNSDIAEMIFGHRFGMQSVVNEMELNKNKLQLSIIQTLILIKERLPEIISKY